VAKPAAPKKYFNVRIGGNPVTYAPGSKIEVRMWWLIPSKDSD